MTQRQDPRQYYLRNRERIRAQMAARYRKNRKHILKLARERYAADPALRAWRHQYHLAYRLRKYDLTLTTYAQLLRKQRERCAICRIKPKQRLHIDHDHTSGIVRGLLCGSCNRAIGLMRDQPKQLRQAADYLERRAA